MSILTEINRITSAKTAIINAIKAKNVDIPNNVSIEDIASYIELIGLKSAYTNQVPISIDTDGSIFNGKGWIGASRLSSSGVVKSATYSSATGYIPASSGAVIRIKGTDWINSSGQSTNYVCAYDSNFNFISAVNCTGSYGGGTVSGNSDIAVVTLNNNANIAYVRVSSTHVGSATTEGPGSYMIVTVNEEITD